MTQPTFTVNIYEKENGKYWPVGQYTFDTRKAAINTLAFHICEGICGIVRSGDLMYAYGNMTHAEAEKIGRGLGLIVVAKEPTMKDRRTWKEKLA